MQILNLLKRQTLNLLGWGAQGCHGAHGTFFPKSILFETLCTNSGTKCLPNFAIKSPYQQFYKFLSINLQMINSKSQHGFK